MTGEDFIAHLDRQEIPPHPPGTGGMRRFDFREGKDFRGEATKRGMWALVYRSFAQMLAEWIGDRTVLEVMAGRGWLAKALSEEGVDIIATDDKSWDDRHVEASDVFPVHKMDAVEAARTIDADVLIMSWSPYAEEVATEVLKVWGEDRPVVYIGEERGGCNAPDSFWQHWRKAHGTPEIPLAQWYGLHDVVEIGYYTATPHHVCPDCGGWIYNDGWCSNCD